MAVQPSHTPRPLQHARRRTPPTRTRPHAASKAKPSLSAEEGEGGGFAAQLLKAQPAAARICKAADARPKAEAAKKPSDDKDGKASADAKDDEGRQGREGRRQAAARPGRAAALRQQQPVAPPTTSLADKAAAAGDHDDFASDPLGALRKGAAKGGKDDGEAALLAAWARTRGAGTRPPPPAGKGRTRPPATSPPRWPRPRARTTPPARRATPRRDAAADPTR